MQKLQDELETIIHRKCILVMIQKKKVELNELLDSTILLSSPYYYWELSLTFHLFSRINLNLDEYLSRW